MATFIWTASTSGQWADPSNWSPQQVPGSADTALVLVPGAYLVDITDIANVSTLILGDEAAEISVSGSLTVTDTVAVSAGSLRVLGFLDADTFSNAAVISDAGTVIVSTLFNTGDIDITGVLTLNAGDIVNTGTIKDNGVLVLGGSLDGAELGTITGGGTIDIVGTLFNAGGTLAPKGPTVDIGGDVIGGTVANVWLFDGAMLDGVIVTAAATDETRYLPIQNGLTFLEAGGGPGQFSFAQGGTIDFVNSETVDNVLMNGDGTIVAAGTLTSNSNVFWIVLPQNFDVGPSGDAFTGGGTILSHGGILGVSNDTSVDSQSNDAVIAIQNLDFENFGLIDVSDLSAIVTYLPSGGDTTTPGFAAVEIGSAIFINHAGGLIETGQNAGTGSINISYATHFTNDGTLSTSDGNAPTGGTIDVASSLAGNGIVDISGGGQVVLASAASSQQTIDFLGAGTLTLDQPSHVAAGIDGFTGRDTIVLNSMSVTAISYSSGDLKLLADGNTVDLGITGTFTLSDFKISDGPDATTLTVPCFAAGSRIATEDGAVRVEDLRIDDIVRTLAGGCQPIRWIGRRDVDCRRHPDPVQVWPIRIAPDAFGTGLPDRALLLSQDHAVFVDDMLVPIRCLINGTSIARRQVARIAYFHIELPKHDILLAEGLPTESYLDTGDRSAFTGGPWVMQLHPTFGPDADRCALIWENRGYAPLVVEPARIDPIRNRLQQMSALPRTAARQDGRPARASIRPPSPSALPIQRR